MSDHPTPQNEPNWLDEFEQMANDQLGEGSACEQVHPIVERWYTKLLEGDPPPSRDSVIQAMSCLATEILNDSPEDLLEAILEHVSEEDLAGFVEYVLMVGRAFELALKNGELDDL